MGKIIPSDIFTYCVDKFIQNSSKLIKETDRVLDAGAGDCPHKKYFIASKYESTDINGSNHTFLCNIENIPVSDETYDVIINTQVLEHVENPQKAIHEFYRILRPGGKLFLTAPQGWKLHGEPNNFFYFTKYGLHLLFRNAGFSVIYIESQGGVFWYISEIIRTLPLPIIKSFIQLFLFHLDKFDMERKFTIGHECYCIKVKQG
jgi:SAM-dependent methyltransferase